MYRFFQMFKRDFLNLLFNPMWVFYGTVFPFMLVLILGFLSSGNYGDSVTAYDYYGISMIIYIILNTSTLAANSFMEERIKAGNMRIIYSPVPKGFIYTSKIAATAIFSSLCHLLVVLVLNLILSVNFGGKDAGYVIIILILFEIFVSILGILFCCIFKSESAANQLLSIITSMLALLGGLFFRLEGMGITTEKISYISPVKWFIAAIFKIIYDSDFSDYRPTVIILIGLSLVTLFLCRKFYSQEEYI